MTLSGQCEREVATFHEFLEAWMGGEPTAGGAGSDGTDAGRTDTDRTDLDGTGADETGADESEPTFGRAEAVLPDDFEMVSPDGGRRDGPTVRADVRESRGAFAASDPPLRARVANVRTRFDDGEHCLVAYEEWQRHDGDWKGRVSSALFRRRADAPNGVEWVHLHETWLPDGADPPTE